MDKEDLLDSKGLFDIRMLEQIFHSHGHMSKPTLIDYMQTTPRMVSDHIASLNDELSYLYPKAKINLEEQRSSVDLTMKPDFSLEELTNRIIRDALPYKILSYVFWHIEFTMQKMQQDLLVSESTLFRTMNRVNSLLAEFNISIKNNNINGREMDIRHFFYKLFISLDTDDPRLIELTDPHFINFVKDYEAVINTSLSEIALRSMRIYWNITLQRLRYKNPDYTLNVFNIKDLMNNNYGQSLMKIFESNFTFFPKINEEFELLNFLAYSTFEHVLPMESSLFKVIYTSKLPYIEKIRATVSEIMSLLTIKFDTTSHDLFLRYSLFCEFGNIMSIPGVIGSRHQMIYTAMKGEFWTEDSGQIHFIKFIIHRLQGLDPIFKQENIVHFMRSFFTSLELLLLQDTLKVFKIGFYDMHEQSINYYLINGIYTQLINNFHINLDNFTHGEKYDIVLTTTNYYDTTLLRNSVPDPTDILEFKDFGTEEDFHRILKLLDTLVSQYLLENLANFY